MRAGFVWDDDDYVTENPLIVAPDGLYRIWFSKEQTSQYFPLVYTTFRIEHRLWGFNPSGYHITNILLHIINSLLLWRLLSRLNVPGAWFAAAIFALHPVQVESVAWITERKNVLMTLFFFLSLLAWVRFIDKPEIRLWRFYFLSLGLYALALFSKTTACTIPAALVLILWIKRIPIDKRRWLQIAPYLVLGLAMGTFIVWWEHHHQGTGRLNLGLNPAERLLLAARALWFYIGRLIWPAKLTFSYPKWDISWTQPVQYLWLIAWLIVGWGMWRWRERLGRPFIAGVVFFVATLSPLLGFISLYTFRYTYVADHYQYVASIGLITIAVASGCRAAAKIRLLPAVAPIILAAYGILTWQQCHVYRNVESLWRDTIAKNPNSWIAHNNLGSAIQLEGRLDEAAEQYIESLRLNPEFYEAHANLGTILAQRGKFGEAIKCFREAIRFELGYAEAYCGIGIILEVQGRIDEAIEHYRMAVKIKPSYAQAHYNLANVLKLQGKLDEAISHYLKAVEIKPSYAQAHYNLANVLKLQGKLDEAISHYLKAVEIKPNSDKMLFNLAVALGLKGKSDEAISHFRQALRLNPNYAEAHYNIGIALESQGKPGEAIEHYRKAIEIEPNYTEAHYNLGNTLKNEGKFDGAAEQYQQVLQIKPDYVEAHNNLGNILSAQGKLDAAANHFRKALESKPDSAEISNNLAWILATAPDLKVRDANEAVVLAERAAELTKHRNATILTTLAAAYAAAGRIEEAVTVGQSALSLATADKNERLVNQIRKQLEEYGGGRK
jgi:tetratricopeptide (TPR) repeat protein